MNTSKKQGNGKSAHLFEDLLFQYFWEGFGDLPIGIIVIDARGNIRFINSMAGYFRSIQPSVATGKPIRDVFPNSQILDTLTTGIPHYNKQMFNNGQKLRCSFIPVKINAKVVCAIELMLDYSKIFSQEHELAELKEKCDFLEVLMDQSFEELGAVDREGRVTYLTEKSARNLGVDRDEALGSDVSIIDPDSLLKTVAETGKPQVAKISRPHKNAVPVMVVPFIQDDQLAGAICKSIFTDVDEAKSFVNKLQKSNSRGKSALSPARQSGCKFSIKDIIGKSKTIGRAKKKLLRVAEGDSSILITGESGTGKELFAQAIHMASFRRNGPFVRVNCAGIPENLLESELFGYEPGSFTGAQRKGKPGKFELAHNGTIFLDEAGEMSMGMQAKLLTVIQENEVERVGGTMPYEVDVRIIAATNKDLWEMVQKGQYREDLYYRLDVVNIHIPPLRDRINDVSILINHFLPIINKRTNSNVKGVTPEVLEIFKNYDWPGNIRELRNVLEGAMNLNYGEIIDVDSLPSRIRPKKTRASRDELHKMHDNSSPAKDQDTLEKESIVQALKVKNGNKVQAARSINMSRSTFYYKLKKYNIDTISPPA